MEKITLMLNFHLSQWGINRGQPKVDEETNVILYQVQNQLTEAIQLG